MLILHYTLSQKNSAFNLSVTVKYVCFFFQICRKSELLISQGSVATRPQGEVGNVIWVL